MVRCAPAPSGTHGPCPSYPRKSRTCSGGSNPAARSMPSTSRTTSRNQRSKGSSGAARFPLPSGSRALLAPRPLGRRSSAPDPRRLPPNPRSPAGRFGIRLALPARARSHGLSIGVGLAGAASERRMQLSACIPPWFRSALNPPTARPTLASNPQLAEIGGSDRRVRVPQAIYDRHTECHLPVTELP